MEATLEITALLRLIKSKTTSAPVVIPASLIKLTIPTAVPNPVIVVPVATIPAPLLNSSPYTSSPILKLVIIPIF